MGILVRDLRFLTKTHITHRLRHSAKPGESKDHFLRQLTLP